MPFASLLTAISAEALTSALTIVASAIIALVTVPVSPVVITLPLTFGNVIVRSALDWCNRNRGLVLIIADPSNANTAFCPSNTVPVNVGLQRLTSQCQAPAMQPARLCCNVSCRVTTEILLAVWPAIAFETSISWNVDPLPSEINMSGGAKLTPGAGT